MKKINQLINLIKNEELVYIQTHDFPDHDAVASAFGLQYLLKKFGIDTHIIYEGDIQRDLLKKFIQAMDIHITHSSEHSIQSTDKIIIVDGCKGNRNVTDLIGDEVAVIDHHESTTPEDVPFCDIRPSYGSCATLIYAYFENLDIDIPRHIATALLTGLLVDTALMMRGVSKQDLTAYSRLYMLSDIAYVKSSLMNNLQLRDLDFYRKALEKIEFHGKMAFCYFDEGCNQNLLGIMSDFFLSLAEVDFVLLCAKNDNQINFSVRSENPSWNAALIIKELLRGTGFGGGHKDMAGGIIQQIEKFDNVKLLNKLKEILLRV